jgi:hypothetical protein
MQKVLRQEFAVDRRAELQPLFHRDAAIQGFVDHEQIRKAALSRPFRPVLLETREHECDAGPDDNDQGRYDDFLHACEKVSPISAWRKAKDF